MRKSAFLIQCLVRFWSHTYDVAENSVVQPFSSVRVHALFLDM